MDSLTLFMVMCIFLICLGLHFATVSSPPPPPPPPPQRSSSDSFPAAARKLPPLIIVHPAVLRQNVAVARLMR